MAVFGGRRSWWREWGALAAALGFLWWGIGILLGWTESPKLLFGSEVFTKWFLVIFSPLMTIVLAYRWVGPRLGFPRVEVTQGVLDVVDIFGRHRTIDLNALGPAYVYDSIGPAPVPYLVFYRAEREAALRQANQFAPPTDFTADVKVPLPQLVGKGLPTATAIAQTVNAARVEGHSAVVVSDADVARVVKQHQRSSWIGKILVILLLITGGLFEFLSEREISWFWLAVGFVAVMFSLGVDHLQAFQNKWLQRAINLVLFAFVIIVAYFIAALLGVV